MSKTTVRLSEIVTVPDLYPREALDSDTVAWMRDVLYNGGEFPPLVIDPDHRLVDGAHRAAAYRIVRGSDAGVVCEVRSYKSDADLLLDAIRLNAGHGKPLDQLDRRRCAALAQKHSISVTALATALNVRADRVKSIRETFPTQAASLSRTSTPTSRRNGPRTGRPAVRSTYQMPVSSTGLDAINRLLIQLQDGDIDVRDVSVRQAVRNLVRVALERLKETES